MSYYVTFWYKYKLNNDKSRINVSISSNIYYFFMVKMPQIISSSFWNMHCMYFLKEEYTTYFKKLHIEYCFLQPWYFSCDPGEKKG
jgi:hypothetical protein